MRFLLQVTPTVERFNALIRQGQAGPLITKILDELKPEASYFTEFRGKRCWILVVDLPDESAIPRFAEPFFLAFDAEVEFHPAMTAADLGHSGLDALGKKWG